MRLIEIGVERLGILVENILPAGPLNNMITDGIIGGVGGVIIFLPNILILFMGISFMEDTGYMARAAFIMDKIMHKMGGLHGKSFIPLVMGFGCNLPAIMATRTLENRRDRILSILINPFMSCSARLPVYVLFCGIFFKEYAGNVILSLYLIGIIIAFLSAKLFKYFFFQGESAPFVMELPPYRMATFKTILFHMWDRSSQYLKKMGGIILIASIIIWVLGEYPKSPAVEEKYNVFINELKESYSISIKNVKKEFGEDSEQANMFLLQYKTERQNLILRKKEEKMRHTYIGIIGDFIYPALEPLGFNWQMGISLTTGIVAKEIVVSTLGVLFHASEDTEATGMSFEEVLKREEYGITPLVAYTFMLFVLLYIPCIATTVVISKEAGLSWALFSLAYQLAVAWVICFIFYNTSVLLGF